MCIIFIGKTKDITKLDLAAAWQTNSHGAGIVIPSKQPEVVKGIMKLKDLCDLLSRIPARQTIAVHLRLATHGSIAPKNTHPFMIEEHSYLMHNGILHGLGKSGYHGMSDSAHLAKILQSVSLKDRGALLNALPGKFAIIDRGSIKMYGAFEKESNVHMSNTYWMPDKKLPRSFYGVGRHSSIWTSDRNGTTSTVSDKPSTYIVRAIDMMPDNLDFKDIM